MEKRVSGKIQFRIDSEIPLGTMVNLNRSLFQWVIENICKNSVDSIEGDGKITLRLFKKEKHELILDITDTGKGIPKQKLKQIFRPGYTSKTRGWGLGLTLSQRIIEKYHKGKIFVKNSQLNQGTTFRILLPA